MKKTRIIWGGICLAVLYFVGPRWEAEGGEAFMRAPQARPFVAAHRGGALTAPENTIEAFEHAIALGVDILEFDTHISKDGKLLVIHDPTLDRTTNGTGEVSQLTAAEIQQYNAASKFSNQAGENPWADTFVKVPLFEEVLDKYQDDTHILMMIELKNKGELGEAAAKEMARLITAKGYEARVMVGSFQTDTIEAFRKAAPQVKATSASLDENWRYTLPVVFGLDRWWNFPGAISALLLPTRYGRVRFDNATFIDRAHEHNQPVYFWTINEASDMRMLAENGADGILTDDPALLQEVLDELYPAALNKPLLSK